MSVSFTVSLAQNPIAVDALFESTKTFCRDYLSDETPKYRIVLTQADVDAERDRSDDPNKFSDAYYETLALYRKIADRLLSEDVLLFHGAGLSAGGEGVIFTAPSGTGKTTHIRLWQKLAYREGLNVSVVNGDKPLLRVSDDGTFLCGTPWQGKEKLGRNVTVPLRAIVILRRGESNEIEKIAPKDALDALLRQSYQPEGLQEMIRYLTIIDKLSKTVDFYSLYCNMDISAAETAYHAIFGN